MPNVSATPRARRIVGRTAVALVFALAELAACGGNGAAATDPGPRPGPGNPSGAIPESFVGTWYAGNVSGVIYHNPNSGHWSSPSGTGVTFTFNRDGSYEKGVLLQSSLYNCTMRFLAYQRGTVRTATTAGTARLALVASYARIKSTDNCVQANNYEKEDPNRAETILVEPGRDQFGNEVLFIRSPDGSASAFHRR